MSHIKRQEENLQEKVIRLEQELEQLRKKQENIVGKNISFQDFLAVLTHKILTPMNSIIGLTNFLKDTNLNKEQQQLTEGITSSGISLVNIYNEILDFAQIDPEDKTKQKEVLNLEKSINEVINQFYIHAYNNKNVEVVPLIPETMQVMLKGDKKRLEQILLLSLGEPAPEAGKKKITLEIADYDSIASVLNIRITHQPSVLSNQLIHHLTGDNTKTWLESVNSGNSFFKFMFAKRITEIAGGTFTVQKGEDLTQLHIALPMERLKDNMVATKKTNIPEFNGLNALVVVGNIAYQQQLKKILSFWGIKTFIAQSEKDAIMKTIREGHLNFLIISDELPDTTAKSLAKKIKALPGKGEIPIIELKSKQSLLPTPDVFIDQIYSSENQTTIFEKLLKNISLQKIKREPYKLDSKLATKIPLSILVIEDDKTNLELMVMLLKKLGYNAATAMSGKDGLNTLRSKTYDIVFLDIQMPVMDGFKVARMIRDEVYNGEKVKTIAISANTLKKTEQKAYNAGMVDFIAKPISFKKIEEAIIRWGFAESLLKQNS
jgi:CheY-like chemotaxis protein